MAKRRVAVVGVGTVGAQALRLLALDDGVEAVGYEMRTPGHPFGAAGGESRIFRRVLGLGHPGWSELSNRAYAGYGALEAEFGVALRSYLGHVMVGPSDDPELARIDEEASRMGVPVEHLDADQVRRVLPYQSAEPSDRGILEREAGVFRPELINLLSARSAVQHGATLHSGLRVAGIDETPDAVHVTSAAGVDRFDRVIITTGAWAGELLPSLKGRVAIHKPVSAWFALRGGRPINPLTPTMRTQGEQYYAIPNADGRMIKLGWAGTVQSSIADAPTALDREISPSELEGFTTRIRRHFPDLDPAPLRVNPYFEGYASNGRPVIGKMSSRIVVGVGMTGWGFTFGPAYAEALCALAVDARPPADIGFLSPVKEPAVARVVGHRS